LAGWSCARTAFALPAPQTVTAISLSVVAAKHFDHYQKIDFPRLFFCQSETTDDFLCQSFPFAPNSPQTSFSNQLTEQEHQHATSFYCTMRAVTAVTPPKPRHTMTDHHGAGGPF
jgi:hypothetical protein